MAGYLSALPALQTQVPDLSQGISYLANIPDEIRKSRMEERKMSLLEQATAQKSDEFTVDMGTKVGQWAFNAGSLASSPEQWERLKSTYTPYAKKYGFPDLPDFSERDTFLKEGAALFDPNYGKRLETATKPPHVETFYNEQGQEIKKQWNPQSGQWETMPGAKGKLATSDPVLQSKVDAGLANLRAMADTYDDASFESALGPLQGAEPDSIVGAGVASAARLGGEISGFVSGAKTPATEVRSNIRGATEALAAAVKPLIRGPGEGIWTDADQKRLVDIVGDLATSRNKAEFKRRLNAVRDRIKANFGLDLKFDAESKATTKEKTMADPVQMSDDELLKALGQ